jgi:hypothetical protein
MRRSEYVHRARESTEGDGMGGRSIGDGEMGRVEEESVEDAPGSQKRCWDGQGHFSLPLGVAPVARQSAPVDDAVAPFASVEPPFAAFGLPDGHACIGARISDGFYPARRLQEARMPWLQRAWIAVGPTIDRTKLCLPETSALDSTPPPIDSPPGPFSSRGRGS